MGQIWRPHLMIKISSWRATVCFFFLSRVKVSSFKLKNLPWPVYNDLLGFKCHATRRACNHQLKWIKSGHAPGHHGSAKWAWYAAWLFSPPQCHGRASRSEWDVPSWVVRSRSGVSATSETGRFPHYESNWSSHNRDAKSKTARRERTRRRQKWEGKKRDDRAVRMFAAPYTKSHVPKDGWY